MSTRRRGSEGNASRNLLLCRWVVKRAEAINGNEANTRALTGQERAWITCGRRVENRSIENPRHLCFSMAK